jgi:hypothetical protein
MNYRHINEEELAAEIAAMLRTVPDGCELVIKVGAVNKKVPERSSSYDQMDDLRTPRFLRHKGNTLATVALMPEPISTMRLAEQCNTIPSQVRSDIRRFVRRGWLARIGNGWRRTRKFPRGAALAKAQERERQNVNQ